MQKVVQTSAFIIAVLLYLYVRLGRTFGYFVPEIFNSYLSDFLCMPIVLALSLVLLRKIKKIPDFKLPLSMIFGMTLFYAILFEFILPYQSAKYTADFIDVIMYFLGAYLYWRTVTPKVKLK